MDYNNLDLRHKTFLDFTNDKDVIEEILGSSDQSAIDRYKNVVLNSQTNSNAEEARINDFMEFTEFIKDEKLKAAIIKEFSHEWELSFNE
jgi:hypothetical protein